MWISIWGEIMEKETTVKTANNLTAENKKDMLALSNSYVNGHLTLEQMIDTAKKFGLANKLTAEIYKMTVRVTDAQIDGQISAKEFKNLYNFLTRPLTDKDKTFLKLSHSVLYSHDHTAIKE